MILIKSGLTFFLALLISCSSTNKTVKKTGDDTKTTTEMATKTSEMTKDGFLSAEVVESKVEGDCPFALKLMNGDSPYFLDPINMTDQYKVNGEKLWIKFSGLRRMNRCDKASPVNITEIEKRVE